MRLLRINSLILASFAFLCVGTTVGSQGVAQSTSGPVTGKAALQYANPLVGTAPLDNPAVIGNAPPPGEQLYSGFVPPGPLLPHGPYEATPVNVNLAVQYPAGVSWPYYYPIQHFLASQRVARAARCSCPSSATGHLRRDSRLRPIRNPANTRRPAITLSISIPLASMQNLRPRSTHRSIDSRFPPSDKAHLLLSLDSVSGHVEIVNDHTLRGVVDPGPDRRQDGAPSGAYFVAEFSRPFTSFGTFRQVLPDKPAPDNILGYSDVQPQGHSVDGASAGAYLDLHTTAGEQVLVKIAHGYSYGQAEARLHAEQPRWDFEGIRGQAEAAWAEKLGRIEVDGGTEHQRAVFYSTLLHSYTSPRLLARKGESFVGLDNQQHVATHGFYGPVPFWDTGRNQVTLLTLLEPKVMQDILQSQLDMARESGYMGTSFHGDNAVFMYLGAWKSGIPFDHAGVYEYLRKNATDPAGPRHYLAEYMKQGWICDIIPPFNPNPPYAGGKAGAATTLEYAWDDYALSQYAEKLGHNSDAALFLKRAYSYRNVFDPAVGFMRGRTADGAWAAPSAGPDKGTFNPQEPYYNFMMKEGSGWSTLWLVPQDVAGLVHLLGGRDKTAAKLDAFFSTPYTPAGICRDCTGLVGQYVQGNQPDQQAAYYYDWVGQPWKTQQLVRRILREIVRQRSRWPRVSGHGRPGVHLVVVRDERDGLLSRRSVECRLHSRQSHLRPRHDAHRRWQDVCNCCQE